MRFLKKLLSIISGKKYRKCPDGAAINRVTQQALNAGLINSEQIMAYCDSYATGLAQGTLVEGLSLHWGINSPAEAAETLGSLSRYGHRFFTTLFIGCTARGLQGRAAMKFLRPC